jgi:hypothetical protein
MEKFNKNNIIKYIYGDIFTLKNVTKFKPNILILQYLLSDMKANNMNIEEFLNKMISYVIDVMPQNSFIIINDINHNIQARDYFDFFIKILHEKYHIQENKYHFHNNNKEYTHKYGTMYENNNILMDIPENINEKYSPWEFCTSAQTIIKKC